LFLIVHLLRTRIRRRCAAVTALSDNLNNSVRCRSIAPVSFSSRPFSWPVVLIVHHRLRRTTKTRVTYAILFVTEQKNLIVKWQTTTKWKRHPCRRSRIWPTSWGSTRSWRPMLRNQGKTPTAVFLILIIPMAIRRTYCQ